MSNLISPFNELSHELALEIFSYLSNKELQQASFVSHPWNVLTKEGMNSRYTKIAQFMIAMLNCTPLQNKLREYQQSRFQGPAQSTSQEPALKNWESLRESILQTLQGLSLNQLNLLEASSAQFQYSTLLKTMVLPAKFDVLKRNFDSTPLFSSERSQIGNQLEEIVKKIADHGALSKALSFAISISDENITASLLTYITHQVHNANKMPEILLIAEQSLNLMKANVISIIAERCVELGDIAQALSTASTIADKEKGKALRKIVQKMPHFEHIEKFLEIARSISDDESRAEALSGLCKRYAECNEIELALAILSEIPPSLKLSQAIQEVISKVPNLKYMDTILTFTQSIANKSYAKSTLCLICETFADFGQIDRALEFIASLPKPEETFRILDRLSMLFSIVIRMPNLEKMARVKELFGTVSDLIPPLNDEHVNVLRALLFEAMAIKYANSGQIDKAIEVTSSMGESADEIGKKIGTYTHIISKSITNEQLNTIQSLVDSMQVPFSYCNKSWLYYALASKHADHGQIENALTAFSRITLEDARRNALAHIVSKLTSIDHFSRGFWHNLDQILLEINAVPITDNTVYGRDQALYAISEKFAEFDQSDKAFHIATTIVDDGKRLHAIGNIARRLSDLTNVDKIHAFADAISTSKEKECVLWGISDLLANAGQWDRALSIASSLSDEYIKSKALASLAEKSPDLKSVGAVRAQADSLTHLEYRDGILLEVSNQFANGAQIEQALDTVDSMGPKKYLALAHLTEKMPTLEHMAHVQTLAQTISDKRDQDQAIAAISGKFTECEQMDLARDVAHSIANEYYKNFALKKIANKLGQLGQLDKAIETVESISIAYTRATAFSELSNCLADRGQMEKAVEVAYLARAQGFTHNSNYEMAKALCYIQNLSAGAASSSND